MNIQCLQIETERKAVYQPFPPEIVEKIFLYLDAADIARLSCVCVAWREIANVDHIWYTHIKMLYDFDIQLLVKF